MCRHGGIGSPGWSGIHLAWCLLPPPPWTRWAPGWTCLNHNGKWCLSTTEEKVTQVSHNFKETLLIVLINNIVNNLVNNSLRNYSLCEFHSFSSVWDTENFISTHENDRITRCCEGGELVEEVRVFLPAAHAAHCAHTQRQIPDQLACGQLIQLQDILHVVQVVDQQVVLVHTGDKACKQMENHGYAASVPELRWWKMTSNIMTTLFDLLDIKYHGFINFSCVGFMMVSVHEFLK